MSARAKSLSRQNRSDGELNYFWDKEHQDPEVEFWRGDYSLYDTVNAYEEGRVFEFTGENTDKLKQLKGEIMVRLKITKQEIFKIGELLHIAKRICREERIRFQVWITENFDFSYETALNFMNVFKQCIGFQEIAVDIPTSILYKISSPSFPDELREYLLMQGNLEKMTNGKFKQLITKYKEGGIESVEEEITELNRSVLIYRQINYTFDMFENALRLLRDLQFKIECRGGPKINAIIGFEDQVKFQEPEAAEISTKLYDTLKNAVSSLDATRKECTGIMNNYIDKVKEKM